MINTDLTAKAVVNILGADDPKVGPEGIINLEIEVSMEMLNFPRLMDMSDKLASANAEVCEMLHPFCLTLLGHHW